jgi:hypothetical protein
VRKRKKFPLRARDKEAVFKRHPLQNMTGQILTYTAKFLRAI